MRKHLVFYGGVILLFALTVNAQQISSTDDFKFKPNQSVYVVAIKTSDPPDPRMRRLLGRAGQEKARRRLPVKGRNRNALPSPDNSLALDRQEPSRVILERSISEADTLTSTDLALKGRLEEEFKIRKKFKIAVSAEAADVVFFAISHYGSHRFQVKPQGITSTTLIGEASGDQMISVVAFAIPASFYRQTRKDFTELGRAALWEGAEVAEVTIDVSAGQRRHSVNEAAVTDLIERFHQDTLKKKGAAPIARALPTQSPPGSAPPPTGTEKKRLVAPGQETDSDPATPGPQDATTISLDTALVGIPISVLDRDGKYIPNLSRRDFHIYEDDVEQEIDQFSVVEAPFHVALLLDTSGSARFKTEDIQNAALAFVEQLRPQDRVMVISFDSRIYVDSEFSGDRAQLRSAIYGIKTRGGTRLYDAVDLSLTERLRRVQGRKAIVLFTDGVDTESRLTSAPRTLELVEESSALVYPVQYDTSADADKGAITVGPPENRLYVPNSTISGSEAYTRASQYLADLAERAGARLYRAENLNNLNQSLSLIAEELRHQYAISYYPTNTARDGSYRRIRVTVSQPNVAVRARAGYRAAAGSNTNLKNE